MDGDTSDTVLLIPLPECRQMFDASDLNELFGGKFAFKGLNDSGRIFFLLQLKEASNENALRKLCKQEKFPFEKIHIITEENWNRPDFLNEVICVKRESQDVHMPILSIFLAMFEQKMQKMRNRVREANEVMQRATTTIKTLRTGAHLAFLQIEENKHTTGMLRDSLQFMVEQGAQRFSNPSPSQDAQLLMEVQTLSEKIETLEREKQEERKYYDEKETLVHMDFNAHMNKVCSAYEEEIRTLKNDALAPSVLELTKTIEYINRKHEIMDQVCFALFCLYTLITKN